MGGSTGTQAWRPLAQRVHFFLKAPKVALQSSSTHVVSSVFARRAHDRRKREATRTEEIIVDLRNAPVADDGGRARGGFAARGSCRRFHCEEQVVQVDVAVLGGSAGGGYVGVASGMRQARAALREAKSTHTTYPAELRPATSRQHANNIATTSEEPVTRDALAGFILATTRRSQKRSTRKTTNTGPGDCWWSLGTRLRRTIGPSDTTEDRELSMNV
jgi:hypothetical protein